MKTGAPHVFSKLENLLEKSSSQKRKQFIIIYVWKDFLYGQIILI